MTQLYLILNCNTIDYFSQYLDVLKVVEKGYWQDRFAAEIRHWAVTSQIPNVKTLSLFSGAGGLDIGFHDVGFDIRSMVEIDEKFSNTLTANTGKEKYFGDSSVHNVDIKDVSAECFDDVDFIIGGPPCQTFSAAGRRAAGVPGLKDSRGNLFEEYVRLLHELQPRGFLFENVYGVIGAENGTAWKKILSAFRGVGYEVSWRILDSADYGVPQHRERVFIVGIKNDHFHFPRPTHGPDSLSERVFVNAATAVHDLKVSNVDASREVRGRFGKLLQDIPPGLNYSFFTTELGHPNPIFAWRSKFSDFLYKAHPEFPVRTLKAQGGQYTGPFHWDNRPFSLGELRRLQTFPDRYVLKGGRGAAIHQIGNSVPPQQARMLALAVLEQVFDVDLPVPLTYLSSNEKLGFRSRKRSLTPFYRKLAAAALGDKKFSAKKVDEKRSFSLTVRPDFTLEVEGAKVVGDFLAKTKLNEDTWKIALNSNGGTHKRIQILVKPRHTTRWPLPTQKVVITAPMQESSLFASWRFFETQLIHHNIKADLVQLCNYYQYTPQINATLSYNTNGQNQPFWDFAAKLTSGLGTRKILSLGKLAKIYELSPEDLITYFLRLRKLGFEIRNHNTNIQIPLDHYLIPYSFPTLTSQSVQRNKHLQTQRM